MLGNLVLLDGKVIRVDAIHHKKVGYHKTCDKLIWVNRSQIKPIKLSKDFLERNGFKEDEWIEGWYDDNHEWSEDRVLRMVGVDGRVVLSDSQNYINSRNEFYVRVDNKDMDSIARAELTYVHELQNLLTFCDIEFNWEI